MIAALIVSFAIDELPRPPRLTVSTAPVLPVCWPLEEVHYMVNWRATPARRSPSDICLNVSLNGEPVSPYRDCERTLDEGTHGDITWVGGPDSPPFQVRAELAATEEAGADTYHVSVLNFPAPDLRLSCRRPRREERPMVEIPDEAPADRMLRPTTLDPLRAPPAGNRVTGIPSTAQTE